MGPKANHVADAAGAREERLSPQALALFLLPLPPPPPLPPPLLLQSYGHGLQQRLHILHVSCSTVSCSATAAT
jgi:hypothetical protein